MVIPTMGGFGKIPPPPQLDPRPDPPPPMMDPRLDPPPPSHPEIDANNSRRRAQTSQIHVHLGISPFSSPSQGYGERDEVLSELVSLHHFHGIIT